MDKLATVKEALEKAVLTAEFHTQYGIKDELRLQALRVVLAEVEPALEALNAYTERLESDELVEIVADAIEECGNASIQGEGFTLAHIVINVIKESKK